MAYRPLEITVNSAKDLKNINLFTKMDVYCVVSIEADPYLRQKHKTHIHQRCGPNPVWNYTMKFNINEAAAQQNALTIKFVLKSKRSLGNSDIGEVSVPVKDLLDARDGNGSLSYAVKTPYGKMKGTLNFSFSFGETFNAQVMQWFLTSTT